MSDRSKCYLSRCRINLKQQQTSKTDREQSQGVLELCCVSRTWFKNGLAIQSSKVQHNTGEILEMNTKLLTKGKSELCKTN